MKASIWITGIGFALATATTVHAQALTEVPALGSDTAVVVIAAAPAENAPIASTTDTPAAAVDADAPIAASIGPVAVQRHQLSTASASYGAVRASGGAGKNVAMMVVGGAALITGAVIGGSPGTIIMVGGAVIGLVGLYHYLQ